MRVFLEDISIWTNRPSKEDLPSPLWVGIIQCTESTNRTKRQRKGRFSLFLNRQPSTPDTPIIPVLRPVVSGWELHHWLPWFFGLQPLIYTTSFPGYPACQNLKMYVLSPIGYPVFLWRTLTNMLLPPAPTLFRLHSSRDYHTVQLTLKKECGVVLHLLEDEGST